MDIRYLNTEIEMLKHLEGCDEITDSGREKLLEFEEIKKTLNGHTVLIDGRVARVREAMPKDIVAGAGLYALVDSGKLKAISVDEVLDPNCDHKAFFDTEGRRHGLSNLYKEVA